ncbi:MAG: FAD-dependent oxidoreductase [Chloroflexi bacterium]|nr:FAD-dependent oxidoreductase [Chloroflexota bacterium]
MIDAVERSVASDCVVIGAGLTGLSAALHLGWRGVRVHVLERGRIGDGTSSKASGWISAQLRTPNALLELVLASLAYYPEFLRRLGDDCGFERCGSLVVFDSVSQLEQRQMLDATQREVATFAGARFLDAAEVHDLEPALAPEIVGGALFEEDAQVEPLRLLEAMVRAAADAGVVVHQGAEVTHVGREGAAWRLRTPIGSFTAPRVVIATGAWTTAVAELAGTDVPVLPVSGQLLVTRPRKGALRRCVVYQPDPRFATKLACGVRPAVDGRLWIGTTYRAGTFDASITAEDSAAIVGAFEKVFPGIADTPIEQAWAGVRPVPADLVPIYGAVRSADGVIAAVPVAGLAEAAAGGRLVADIVCAAPPSVAADPFDPARFAEDD